MVEGREPVHARLRQGLHEVGHVVADQHAGLRLLGMQDQLLQEQRIAAGLPDRGFGP